MAVKGTMIGFGLDLAGFSKPRGTVLAAIQMEKSKATVTLISAPPFSRRRGDGNFADRLKNETDTLKDLVEIGPIAVDVPIDLQGLPLQNVAEPWELTKRPVDEAFNGLAPFASWLGACVARFAAIAPSDLRQKELGVRIFETDPAASLRQLFGENDLDVKQYKRPDAAEARRSLCQRLGIECDGSTLNHDALNHDELDAVICALGAVATPDQLLAEGNYGLPEGKTLPIGYQTLNNTCEYKQIKVSRKRFGAWEVGNSRDQ
jgi:hypothetical protein